tara:strand:+ start:264 stop:371 length:108 start_codon:yes stop_codon:yes gene_type:complete
MTAEIKNTEMSKMMSFDGMDVSFKIEPILVKNVES